MEKIGAMLLGVVMGLFAMLWIFVASRAADESFYYTGLAFAVFCILYIFSLVRRHVGEDQEDH